MDDERNIEQAELRSGIQFINPFTLRSKIVRSLWNVIQPLTFGLLPTPFHAWRRFVLRCFGAKIGEGAHVYPKAKIWAPWNLVMGNHSCLSNHVDCYCVAPVVVGDHAIVSQYSYLCTATHDYSSHGFELIVKPITIGAQAWVAADVFVGPGVTIGEGSVIGARSNVLKDVDPWSVWVGSPARRVKDRRIIDKAGERL